MKPVPRKKVKKIASSAVAKKTKTQENTRLSNYKVPKLSLVNVVFEHT